MAPILGYVFGGALLALAALIMLLGYGEKRKRPAGIVTAVGVACLVLPGQMAYIVPLALLVLVIVMLINGFKTMRW